MKIANDFADVAQKLRGLKRRQDDAAEDRASEGAANLYADVRDTAVAYDRVEASTDDAAGFTWGVDEFDYQEFGE